MSARLWFIKKSSNKGYYLCTNHCSNTVELQLTGKASQVSWMQQTLWNHNHKSCRERPPQRSQSSLGSCGQKRWCSASYCHSYQIIISVSSPFPKENWSKSCWFVAVRVFLRKDELLKHQRVINPWQAQSEQSTLDARPQVQVFWMKDDNSSITDGENQWC